MQILIDNFNGDPWKHTSGEDTSGQNLFVRETATRLALAGHYVDVSTRATSPDDELITQVTNNLRILRFQAGPLMYMFRDNAYKHLNDYISLLLDFCRKQHRYQIIHGNYWPSAKVVCCLREDDCGDTLVYTPHSLGRLKRKAVRIMHPQRDAIETGVFRMADIIHALSQEDERMICELYGRSAGVVLIPHGTNHNNFHYIEKSSARQKLNWNPNELILLFVGRFEAQKNVPTLLKVYDILAGQFTQENKRLRLFICGGSKVALASLNKLPASIRSVFRDLKHQRGVKFFGYIPNNELLWFYAAADVLVAPSIYEPGGLQCREALSCGLPVSATDVGGFREAIVPNLNGLLCLVKDHAALVKNIKILLGPDWQAKTKRMQIASDASSRFSWDTAAKTFEHLYTNKL